MAAESTQLYSLVLTERCFQHPRAQLAEYLSWQVFQHDAAEVAVKQESDDRSTEVMNLNSRASSSAASISPEAMEPSSAMHEDDKEDVIMETFDMATVKHEAADTGSSLAPHEQGFEPPHLHTSLTSDLDSVQVHGTQGPHSSQGP